MTSTFSVRPPTNGNSFGQLNRQTSASSFPSTTRKPSESSLRNGTPTSIRPLPHRKPSVDQSLASSTPSSLNRPALPTGTARPRSRLKSQYPANSTERHVEYIMVASFDIDRGPIMEHQYPGAISGDENMLAELMLPDQAHVRAQDWTLFFLHKDAELDEESDNDVDPQTGEGAAKGDGSEEANASEDEKQERQGEEAEDDEDAEGPPLIYVLNLVNMKHDSSVKRGAVVKAMAVCTRHPFLHIYKPLLILALEEYFKAPYPETLATLYDALNAMDLSLTPKLSTLERQILQASDRKDMFIDKFETMALQRMDDTSKSDAVPFPESPSKTPLILNKKIPPNVLPRDTHELESRVIYNSKPIPIKVPTSISAETVGDFSLIRLVQLFSGPHASSPQPFAIHPHLTTSGAYTHPVIVLVNAVLTQKRIIFLGHNRPSGEVAEIVLAACALASGGVLRGFTRHAFPYTDLTKIDELLNVPGFIAGVTNPAFSHHPEWWDLLCDVPTGRMKISSKIEPAPVTDGLVNFQSQNPMFAAAMTGGTQSGNNDPSDSTFIEDLLKGIAARHGETAIRSKWREYITRFTRVAAAFEEAVYGASALYVGAHEADAGLHGVKGHGYVWPDEQTRAKELAANVYRIEGWRNTRSYYAFIQDLAALWERRPIRSIDLAHQHDRLRSHKLTHDESGAIYLAFAAAVNSYDEICQLLTVTPEQKAGLFYISLGLFHPDVHVREAIVDLLDRIQVHEAGRHFWSQIGRFAKLAYARIKKDREKRMMETASPVDDEGLDARITGTQRGS